MHTKRKDRKLSVRPKRIKYELKSGGSHTVESETKSAKSGGKK